MKKPNANKRLLLTKENIRSLSNVRLSEVAGGLSLASCADTCACGDDNSAFLICMGSASKNATGMC